MIRNKDGVNFKWFATSEDIEMGSKVRLKGTIQSIEPDKYMKNAKVINLTRCKVLHVYAAKEEMAVYHQSKLLNMKWLLENIFQNSRKKNFMLGLLNNITNSRMVLY